MFLVAVCAPLSNSVSVVSIPTTDLCNENCSSTLNAFHVMFPSSALAQRSDPPDWGGVVDHSAPLHHALIRIVFLQSSISIYFCHSISGAPVGSHSTTSVHTTVESDLNCKDHPSFCPFLDRDHNRRALSMFFDQLLVPETHGKVTKGWLSSIASIPERERSWSGTCDSDWTVLELCALNHSPVASSDSLSLASRYSAISCLDFETGGGPHHFRFNLQCFWKVMKHGLWNTVLPVLRHRDRELLGPNVICWNPVNSCIECHHQWFVRIRPWKHYYKYQLKRSGFSRMDRPPLLKLLHQALVLALYLSHHRQRVFALPLARTGVYAATSLATSFSLWKIWIRHPFWLTSCTALNKNGVYSKFASNLSLFAQYISRR